MAGFRALRLQMAGLPGSEPADGRPHGPRVCLKIHSHHLHAPLCGVSFTGGIGKISGVVVGVLIFTVLIYSLTILGIDTNLQFVFEGIIIITAVTLDCLKYVQKK